MYPPYDRDGGASGQMPPPPGSGQRYQTPYNPGGPHQRAPHPPSTQQPPYEQRPELPSLSSIRSGSGMPIWSMIDADAPRPERPQAPPSVAPSSATQAAAASVQMAAPQLPYTGPGHRASASWEHTPTGSSVTLAGEGSYQSHPQPRAIRTGSAGSPPSSYIGSPERTRAATHQSFPPIRETRGRDDSHGAEYNRRFDMRFQPMARQPGEHVPARPYSQMSDTSSHTVYGDRYSGHATPANGDGAYARDRAEGRDTPRDGIGTGNVSDLPGPAPHHDGVDRFLHSGRHTTSPSTHIAPRTPPYQVNHSAYASQNPHAGLHEPGAYSSSVSHERPVDVARSLTPAAAPGSLFDTHTGRGIMPMQLGPAYRGRDVSGRDGPSGSAVVTSTTTTPQPIAGVGGNEVAERRSMDVPYVHPYAISGPNGLANYAAFVNRDTDEGAQGGQQTSRNLLSIQPENGRRGGRNSPLPQAVQGVQGQRSGPAGEPGIKSAFGRMFSGIGSGVGSGVTSTSPNAETPQPPYAPSPRPEPQSNRERTTEAGPGNAAAQQATSNHRSRGTKRVRKEKEVRDAMEVDGGEESGQTKRNRHGHGHGHHHHHHALGPQ